MIPIVAANLARVLIASVALAAQPSSLLHQPISSHSSRAPAALQPQTSEPGSINDRRNTQTPGRTSAAALSDFSWLQGKWQGDWGPRVAEQVWTDPRAGEMAGVFRVTENDKTLVLELYSLVETPDGIELRLRHFTPSLVPWEPKVTVLKLASFDPSDITFESSTGGQPSRNNFTRIDADTYLFRTEIISPGESKRVTEIRFHRVKSPAEQAPSQPKKK